MVLEKTLQSPLDLKEIQTVHPKGNQSWMFIGRTDVEAETPILWPPDCDELTHLKRPWCWERLRARGEGDDRGCGGWMASPTWGTWVWASSGSWWWTGKPGVLQSMGSQRVGHDWVTELNWTELIIQVGLGLKWTKSQTTQFKILSKICRKLYLWYIFYHIILPYGFVTLLYSTLSINFFFIYFY